MIKKLILLCAIITIVVLFGPRLIVFSFGAWDYYNTDISCKEAHIETSMTELESPLPVTMLVLEVKPFAALTDRGYMFPGDEYEAYGEGEWYGMATLIFVGKKGATFLVDYPIDDPISGYSRRKCRSFIPIDD